MMDKKEAGIWILCIILIAVAVRIFFLFDFHELWWDSAVYVAMGKYIFSMGKSGFFEPIRPVVWPVILGFAWYMKIDVVFFGKVFQMIASACILYLIYRISSHAFDRAAGVVAAAIFGSSQIFFYSVFHLYTEIPAVFFVLVSLLLLFRKQVFLSGIFLAIAVLTKFPVLVFFFAMLPAFEMRNIFSFFRSVSMLFLGLVAGMSPFLISSLVAYGSVFYPFIQAHKVILEVVGCNVLWYNPWHYYFWLFLQENILYLIIPFSLVFVLRNHSPKRLTVALFFLLPFSYFLVLHCRDYRYMVIFLPFAAMLAAGFFSEQLGRLPKWVFCIFLSVIIVTSMPMAILYYHDHEPGSASVAREEYYHFLSKDNISGEVWISNPAIAAYSDELLFPLYYPVFNDYLAREFYIKLHGNRIGYVFLDICGGGITCHPDDYICQEGLSDILWLLQNRYQLVYNATEGDCSYLVFRSS